MKTAQLILFHRQQAVLPLCVCAMQVTLAQMVERAAHAKQGNISPLLEQSCAQDVPLALILPLPVLQPRNARVMPDSLVRVDKPALNVTEAVTKEQLAVAHAFCVQEANCQHEAVLLKVIA